MKKTFLILSFAVFCAPAFASAAEFSPEEIEAARKDPQAFVLDRGSVRIIRVNGERAPEPPPNVPPVPPVPGPLPPSPLPPGGINPDIIVNIGKMIWEIIEANRPVVDVKQSYATAVPDGITHWTQLAGWSPPELTVYELSAKNMRGGNAVQVRFQVMRTAGGSFQGKGKYLTGVTIEPLMISVSSGYKFYLEAAVPAESVANHGSHDDPIAGMIATLKWKIKTAANETQGARLYYLQGDGLFKDITGFPQSFKEDSQKALRGLQSPIVW